jgi:hypothetical protein
MVKMKSPRRLRQRRRETGTRDQQSGLQRYFTFLDLEDEDDLIGLPF